MSRPTVPAAIARITPFLVAPLVALVTADLHGDTITLRADVRLPDQAEAVHLADVAELEGPLALAMAEVVVATRTDPQAPLRVELDQVRARLSDAGVHWGKVHLRGRGTTVEPGSRSAAAPRAMTGATLEGVGSTDPGSGSSTDAVVADRLLEESSERGRIARFLCQTLGVSPSTLRLRFLGADTAALRNDDPGGTIEIEPLSNLHGDRLELSVRRWREGRAESRSVIIVDVERRVNAAVAARTLARSTLLSTEDLRPESRWVRPGIAGGLAPIQGAVGRVLDARLEAGTAVKISHLRPDLVVQRRDLVMVRCLVGGLIVAVKAEARGDGAVGDVIECRKVGERETFLATVTGPGEAVVDLDARSEPAGS